MNLTIHITPHHSNMLPELGSCQAIGGTAWVTSPHSSKGHATHSGIVFLPVLGSSFASDCTQHASQRQMPAGLGARDRNKVAPSYATNATAARIKEPALLDSHSPPSASSDGDTIAAIVTGNARRAFPHACIICQAKGYMLTCCAGPQGAVSIVRLSGPDAATIAQRLFRPSGRRRAGWAPASHKVYHGHLIDASGRNIDEVPLSWHC